LKYIPEPQNTQKPAKRFLAMIAKTKHTTIAERKDDEDTMFDELLQYTTPKYRKNLQ